MLFQKFQSGLYSSCAGHFFFRPLTLPVAVMLCYGDTSLIEGMAFLRHVHRDRPLEGVYFTDFARDMLERRGKRRSGHYAAVYDAVLRHIDRFSTEFDCDIFTNSVTEEFLDDFIVYLESRGLRHNTIAGYVQKIQSLVRKASQYNYAVDATYDGTDLREEPVNAVFLSMNEIARIYYYKFERQDKRKARERIRDLFVIGCLTALRYSDYSTLTKDNLRDGYIIKGQRRPMWTSRSRLMIM